ncbi:MAG: type II secretion system protein E [Berkelbacteria bacterium GW2011_GWA1_36_9]|uniref:Type II secretion system protein E n=1 Tax=Berkelbacteria bacterium GW2011_GWA1_36_9 TaxID=1618331 RepID=A0A0G0FLX7_9BACT|nr:MAG: type II secretion system protein E [Berkelbacteria bacterium GW2011_GWA1_36_9]
MAVAVKKQLIDVLLQQGKIKNETAQSFRHLSNFEVENKLITENMLEPTDIARAYAGLYNLPFVSLANRQISKETLELIPEGLTRQYNIIAYEIQKEPVKTVRIAIAKPAKLAGNLQETIATLEKGKGFKIELAITTLADFLTAVSQYQASTPPVEKVNFKTLNLDQITIPYEVITKFPENIALKYQMVVFSAPHSSFIKVAVADPDSKKVREILDFVKTKNNIAIEEYRVTPAEIERAIRFYHPEKLPPKPVTVSPPPPPQKQEEHKVEEKKEEKKEEPTAPLPPEKEKEKEKVTEAVPEISGSMSAQLVIPVENDLDKFVGKPIKEVSDLQAVVETGNVPKIVAASVILAVSKKASDIHIEAAEKNVRIRFRVDGLLKDIVRLPLEVQPAVVSRVKILSKLKIDESRIPQDGRFDCIAMGHAVDLRISTLPTVHGEKIAMRLLDKSAHLYTLEELGLVDRNLKVLLENMNKPYGLILSTGPTGSGKTTTLYAVLTRISNASVNIVTLEDPVEYEMAGVNQCQIRPKIGFTFANGLRSILRQDPNIIMVGEIRDSETASLATQAALTGHLVLSTLHTNDASGTLPRLADMGVEPFFITSLINAIIGQRLVRKLCPKCKRQAHIPAPIAKEIEAELEKFNLPKPYQFFEGAGCDECELGYKGRIGIFEVLTMSHELENLILERKPASDIKRAAIKEGMITMKQDGLVKALKGLTTVNEVMRVITV